MATVVTRFAPSPTGKAHAGGYRTAMYAWLFARQQKGEFILRIEDTDRARNNEEAKEDIFEALKWLGLEHDRLYIQSANLARHKEILTQLIREDRAYVSHEPAKDDASVMKDVIRFRNPNKIITFTDLIRGPITIDTTDLGDFVIARAIDDPVYHLAVIVDDHDEGVTHVIRAEEHIANTPRHILLHEALGWQIPHYAHLPLVLSEDKKKLSKRKGALAMTDYAKLGYLSDAVFNCIAMLGWNPADPGSDQELFSIPELIERFDFNRMQKSGAIFKQEKLDWFNREYIKRLSGEQFWEHAEPYLKDTIAGVQERSLLEKLEPLLRERMVKFSDMQHFFAAKDGSTEGEFDYFLMRPKIDTSKLAWKGTSLQEALQHLEKVAGLLEGLTDWSEEGVKGAVMPYAEETGKGNVLWPFRVALSGREKSPDPFTIAAILGRGETLARITDAAAPIK
ncbi:MAG TPA: glutamate--tRNA ligase family protein [Candidatus Paceibacterota bacterium]|nr:glutamate--tRNA ligase family protein [Candidatus Paceibacterota bacterium]